MHAKIDEIYQCRTRNEVQIKLGAVNSSRWRHEALCLFLAKRNGVQICNPIQFLCFVLVLPKCEGTCNINSRRCFLFVLPKTSWNLQDQFQEMLCSLFFSKLDVTCKINSSRCFVFASSQNEMEPAIDALKIVLYLCFFAKHDERCAINSSRSALCLFVRKTQWNLHSFPVDFLCLFFAKRWMVSARSIPVDTFVCSQKNAIMEGHRWSMHHGRKFMEGRSRETHSSTV